MADYNANRFTSQSKSSAWRHRTRSHYENIADLLRERGEQGLGVRGSELYREPQRYGRSPRNRVSELRRNGWNIGGKPYSEGDSDWFYWLRSDAAGKTYPTQRFDLPQKSPRPCLIPQPEVKPWNERPAVTGLPLFDMAVSR